MILPKLSLLPRTPRRLRRLPCLRVNRVQRQILVDQPYFTVVTLEKFRKSPLNGLAVRTLKIFEFNDCDRGFFRSFERGSVSRNVGTKYRRGLQIGRDLRFGT